MPNFKKTLKTTLLFLLTVMILLLIPMEIYFRGENHMYINRHERKELAGTIDCAVIGASHARHGLDTRILDEKLSVNSYNFSGSAMSMPARLDIMAREAARNPLKLVILEVSPSTITGDRKNRSLEGDMRYMAQIDTTLQRLSFFFSAFTPDEYATAMGFFLSEGIRDSKYLLKGTYTLVNTFDDTDLPDNLERCIKGYAEYPANVDPKDMTTNYKKIWHTRELAAVDPVSAGQLQELLDICRGDQAQVILVNMPTSRNRVCRLSGLNDLHAQYRDFARQNQIPYFDLNLLKDWDQHFSDTDSFIDGEHLANDGQHEATALLCDLILRSQSGEDLSPLFYEDYDALDTAMGWNS